MFYMCFMLQIANVNSHVNRLNKFLESWILNLEWYLDLDENYINDWNEMLKLTYGQGHKVKGQGQIYTYVKKQSGNNHIRWTWFLYGELKHTYVLS